MYAEPCDLNIRSMVVRRLHKQQYILAQPHHSLYCTADYISTTSHHHMRSRTSFLCRTSFPTRRYASHAPLPSQRPINRASNSPRSTTHIPSLSSFLLRTRVLTLYRTILRSSSPFPSPQKQELRLFAREEFERHKHVREEEKIRWLISQGKVEVDRMMGSLGGRVDG